MGSLWVVVEEERVGYPMGWESGGRRKDFCNNAQYYFPIEKEDRGGNHYGRGWEVSIPLPPPTPPPPILPRPCHKCSFLLTFRYYCCLFLARMRSAPLIKLDRNTCTVIDELINMFLGKHVPSEISRWEEETSFVWMTMVPLVHLAFAAGQGSCNDSDTSDSHHSNHNHDDQNNDVNCEILQGEEECFLGNKQSTGTMIQKECASCDNIKDSRSSDTSLSSEELSYHIKRKYEELEGENLAAQNALSLDCGNTQHSASKTSDGSASESQRCLIACPGENFTHPGSKSTQKLGIFSLVHMLSIKENQELASAENLIAYLVCLSWQLNSVDRKKLSASLANFHPASPPSLKVAAKSVLARVNGLDMVFNL